MISSWAIWNKSKRDIKNGLFFLLIHKKYKKENINSRKYIHAWISYILYFTNNMQYIICYKLQITLIKMKHKFKINKKINKKNGIFIL